MSTWCTWYNYEMETSTEGRDRETSRWPWKAADTNRNSWQIYKVFSCVCLVFFFKEQKKKNVKLQCRYTNGYGCKIIKTHFPHKPSYLAMVSLPDVTWTSRNSRSSYLNERCDSQGPANCFPGCGLPDCGIPDSCGWGLRFTCGFMLVHFIAKRLQLVSGRGLSDGPSVSINWVNPFPSRFIKRTIFFSNALELHERACCLLFDVRQYYCHFSIFIGSSLYQHAKPPQGTVLFINLLGKGLIPRPCMGDGGSIWWAPVSGYSYSYFVTTIYFVTSILYPGHFGQRVSV